MQSNALDTSGTTCMTGAQNRSEQLLKTAYGNPDADGMKTILPSGSEKQKIETGLL